MLWRAVRARVVLKHSGQLAIGIGAFTLVPVLVASILGDWLLAQGYGALALVFGVAGVLLARIDAPQDMRPNEALVIPALSFVTTPILYAGPPMLAGIEPLDALFESVSGITTTGLSTLGSVEASPPTLLFVRAWQQWIGGLGVVVFALALFVGPGPAALRLGEESLSTEGLVRSTRSRARHFLAAYAVLTLAGFGVLWAAGLPVFDAVTNTLAAVSTGGFSNHDASLAAFPVWGQRAAVIALSILGAISFTLYLPESRGHLRRLARDPGLLGLLALGVVTTGLVLLFEVGRSGAGAAAPLAELPLLAFSAQSTAGFTSVGVTSLAPASKLALIGAMVIGGNIGSTAGGIKVLRGLVLLRVVQSAVQRRSLPEHAVVSPSLGGRRLEDAEVSAALALALLFFLVIGVSWLAFVAYGYAPLDALFEVASATGTVGLSTGIARPELETPLKWILCADMWLGRLEVLPLLVLLTPATWLGRAEAER